MALVDRMAAGGRFHPHRGMRRGNGAGGLAATMSADREWPQDDETEGEEVEGSAYEDDEPYPSKNQERLPHPDPAADREKAREKARGASRTDGGASVGPR